MAASPTAPLEDQTEALAATHRLKLKPPTYDGNYSTFEEWKYKFTAYMGLMDPFYPNILRRAATSTQRLTEADLRGAAQNMEEADRWVQLDNNLKYILVNVTTGAAATVCRQYQHEMGLETYRQLSNRFAIPLGTRSIGYLTKLLKPTFDSNNFEESFSNWEFELSRYERDNNTALPDQIKIAVLMNETSGPLQQHLHLNAGATPTYVEVRETIMEYYRATTALSRLHQQPGTSSVSTHAQGGPAPMDIGAVNKGYKGKYNKGKGKKPNKGKGKNKSNKGKGYGYGYNKGKGKIGQGMQPKGSNNKGGYIGKGKGKPTGKGKGVPTQGCYRCGQPGHIARDCRVAVHNLNEVATNTYTGHWQDDATTQWYQQQQYYDGQWWNDDQTQVSALPQQQLALPPTSAQEQQVPQLHIAAISIQQSNKQQPATEQPANTTEDLMIDSGAATHVCPPWFAPTYKTYELHPEQGPRLTTATEEDITVYGYKWVYMKNSKQQPIVIPFYVCDVSQPILSVTRLASQGFNIQLSDHPTITNTNGFEATLKQQQGLYFLTVNISPMPSNMKLDICETSHGIRATVSPVTITPTGPEWVTHNNDIWIYNSTGYLVRVHKRTRKALFTPDAQCPVPEEQLDNYRRTIAYKPDGTLEDFEDKYKDLPQQRQNRRLPGPAWSGETWFRVKETTKPPAPPLPKASTAASAPASATPKASAAKATTQQQQQQAQQPTGSAVRHREKKPVEQPLVPQQQQPMKQQAYPGTAVPGPKDTPATADYWIKEGQYWKRVHVQQRTQLYIPQQTMDGPDVTKLLPQRQTIVKPTSGARGYRIDDDWTTKTSATMNFTWTGSTNFEESTAFKEEYYNIDEEEHLDARTAKGIKAPEQPTAQERAEHELTHLPYRSWCPTCVQNKGRADNHPRQHSKQPVVQFDFCFFKTLGEKETTPILTGIDVETGMSMAVLVNSKTADFQYHVQCIQTFLMECGRVQAVLNSTILQSDQEDHLIALLRATAAKMGGNITVRQAPTYTSQAQGSVERFHRTLMGQVRTLKSQLQNNYDIRLTSKHPIVAWMVRHTAYLLNRYAIHSDGNTSFFRRWHKEHKTPLCEFGETVLYMLPNSAVIPKMEQRFMPGIWLGKDTTSNENLIGISNKVVRARTIRRLPAPEKYNKQLMDVINRSPTLPYTTGGPYVSKPPLVYKPMRRPATAETGTQAFGADTTQQPQLQAQQPAAPAGTSTRCAIADSPMATAPTSCHTRPSLPSPKRTVSDEVAEGSLPKQHRTAEAATGPARPDTAQEPPTSKLRITKVTIQTKKGVEITAYTCDDITEEQTEKILLEPMVNNTEGFDKQKTIEGMKNEIDSMKKQQVYMEVDINTLTPEQKKNIIQSRWVLRDKGNNVRARIVAKGYTEAVNDLDDIYASTPIFCVLRTLLTICLNRGWIARTGDISTAFLHAAAATADLYMYPPKEFYRPEDNIIWKLLKAIYGLRSSPKAWQNHLAEVLQQLGLQRSTAEPNIFMTPTRDCYILVYVDDLLFLGEQQVVDKLFTAIQQHLLLRPTGTLEPGKTVSFLGRSITNNGDSYDISLSQDYVANILEENNMLNCNPAPAPGTSALKAPTADHEQPLSTDEHAAYRRTVGKLQWMTYTRPDISYATKELARALQAPTTADQQKLKHLLRYLKGTQHYRQVIRPTAKIPPTQIPDLNIYVDNDWAGCPETRRSTTGFLITLLGATINYGSRTQATIALSSAEAELYAINTGATEALHLRNLLMELFNVQKVNIKIHTDSSSGKSMATRIGSSRKAKHIDLKHLFIQQLISHDIVRLNKIHTNENPADIFTKYISTETLHRHLQAAGLNTQHHIH